MKKLLILIILNIFVFSCDPQCKTCSNDTPYGCTSCILQSKLNLYIKSCQAFQSSSLFVGIGATIIVLHLIMIILGYGMYRNVYQNLQMLSLVAWGYGSQNGSNQLMVLNFGYAKNNSFLTSYGAQFFVAITIIGIFILLVTAVDRLPHNSVATLIKRKKIIFPLRLQSLIFNMIIFTAFAQACTISQETSTSDIAGIIVSILALLKQGALLVIIFYQTNFTNFQIDDHNYYILVEKLSTCRWYARNNFFFSLLCRGLTIMFFIVLFDRPTFAGGLMLGTMAFYTLISAVGLKFIKIRYWIFNFIGNLLTCACLFCMYGCGSFQIGSSGWQSYRKAYFILILTLCAFFFLINLVQIFANSNQMSKQLKSIYYRFIICQKMDDAVQLNKYDSDKHRQKVTSFRKNLIYQKDISQREQIQPKQADKQTGSQ